MTIGEKRELRLESNPGPGQYSPEKTDLKTIKRSSPSPDFRQKTGRRETSIDKEGGPGTYEERNTLIKHLRPMTI